MLHSQLLFDTKTFCKHHRSQKVLKLKNRSPLDPPIPHNIYGWVVRNLCLKDLQIPHIPT